MTIKLSAQDAIASIRIPGFTVTAADRELLSKQACGELTSAQMERAILDDVVMPKNAN